MRAGLGAAGIGRLRALDCVGEGAIATRRLQTRHITAKLRRSAIASLTPRTPPQRSEPPGSAKTPSQRGSKDLNDCEFSTLDVNACDEVDPIF